MSKAEQFWDGRAGSYDGRGEAEAQADPTLLAAIERHLHPDDSLLDFGCATGTWSLAVAGRVREVQGVDVSGKMIAAAQAKAARHPARNVRFRQGSLFDPVYGEASLDVIMSLSVLHLLDDLPAVMDRMARLLTPGGRLIANTPCLGQSRSLLSLLMRGIRKTGIVPHLNLLSSRDIEQLITGARLSIVENHMWPDGDLFVVAQKAS
jgi:2-polyprenyl-3-methyl-5-hydroxy-6-metoxy-1,4-benzoquinol methylase